jgi:hypothetical protein
MQVLRFDDKLHDRDSLAKILTLSVMAVDLVEALGCSPERSRRATRMQVERGGIAAMLGYGPQEGVLVIATPLTAVPLQWFPRKVLPCEWHAMKLHADCCGHVSAKQGCLHETFFRFYAGQLVVCAG